MTPVNHTGNHYLEIEEPWNSGEPSRSGWPPRNDHKITLKIHSAEVKSLVAIQAGSTAVTLYGDPTVWRTSPLAERPSISPSPECLLRLSMEKEGRSTCKHTGDRSSAVVGSASARDSGTQIKTSSAVSVNGIWVELFSKYVQVWLPLNRNGLKS